MAEQEPGVRGHDDPRTPLGSLYSLLEGIVARDVDAIVDSYANIDDLHVFVEGPRWQTVGHEAVARGWRDFCSSGMSVKAIELTDGPWIHGVEGNATGKPGDIACISASPRMSFTTSDRDDPRDITLRLTWVMRREEERWRIVHEHASQPLADPYGAGDWLKSS